MLCFVKGLEAMCDALKMEKAGYENLLELHRTADSHGDYDVRYCTFVINYCAPSKE